MSLRTRLILSFTALLVVVIVVVGAVAIHFTRRVLVDQVDRRLVEAAARSPRLPLRSPADFEPVGRGLALVVLSPDGQVLVELPTGFRGAPDPLPDLSQIETLADRERRLVDLPAEDGSFGYRALIRRRPDGVVWVLAAPLRELAAARQALIGILVLSGAVVLVLGGAATWWTVRRGLQPVERMIDTAAAIGSGDLSRRVPDADPHTELGRLGTALNHMLASIERAFAAETAARNRLRQFVADASHELRTPIAAIAGYAELHRKGALTETEEVERAMSRIEQENRRMERLVEDLLLLAKLDLAQPLERRPVDLAQVVENAVADQRAIDRDRPLEVDGPDSLWVSGDEQRLTQVVANLLANARHHTPSGTPVQVSLGHSEESVRLEITDQGPGLPEEALERVFDRFYRVDTSRSRRSGGSGLGLAIVAAIVSAHGGTVTASNSPGHGARFTVTLPEAPRPTA